MKKSNILKILNILGNDTKNAAVQSQVNNYYCTISDMTEEDYEQVKDFYIEFIIKYFQSKINK